jgi:hypothetical protein
LINYADKPLDWVKTKVGVDVESYAGEGNQKDLQYYDNCNNHQEHQISRQTLENIELN